MIIILDAKGNPVAIPEAQANKLGLKPGDVFIENVLYSEHTKNAKPSSKETHEGGQARAKQDREGAKGMTKPPRKRPPNHKGPWPPKPSPPKPSPPKPPPPPTTPPPTTPPRITPPATKQ